jgi:hypothetical protein
MKTKYSALMLLVIFSTLIIGCRSKDLDRSSAAELIRSAAEFKAPFTVQYATDDLKFNDGLIEVASPDETKEQAAKRRIENYFELNPRLGLLNYFGLIDAQVTAREDKTPAPIYYSNPAMWHFAEKYTGSTKAERYWKEMNLPVGGENFPLAQREIIEITGVSSEGNNGIAEFTYRWKANEIGRALDSTTAEYRALPQDLQKLISGEKIPAGEIRGRDVRVDWNNPRRGKAVFTKFDDGWRVQNLLLF